MVSGFFAAVPDALKTIRKACYAAICAGLLLISFDAMSTFLFPGYEAAKEYHDGKEFSKALPIFAKFAKRGDRRAQYYMGRMNHLGEGKAQDKQEAVRWYRMSADQGFARAQNNLGILLLEQGNVSEAVILFNKAIEQGLPQGKINLEAALQKGQTVIQSEPSERPTTSTSLQNAHDPSMEFNFHRLREGLR
ncbi:MAG: tetratricopeptide repeat protein [Desulfuromonadales bacterium]